MRAIAVTLGLEARFRIVSFDGIVPGLQAGRYQAAIGEIFVTPERTAVVTFVQNHVTTDSLLVRADSTIKAETEDALCGLTVSAQLGSAEAKFADSIASRCQSAGKKPLEVKTFQEQAAVNLSVSEGRTDAALGSTSQVVYVIDQIKGKFKAVELAWGPQNRTGIVLARNADTDQLAKAVEAANNKLIQDDQVRAVHAVRPLRKLSVVDRDGSRASALADALRPELPQVEIEAAGSVETAVSEAHIVTCATPATEPVLASGMLRRRVHVNAIGAFRPTMRELPDDLLGEATVVIDDLAAILEESGEILHALDTGALAQDDLTVLGDALTHTPKLRERTVFKTVGVAAQDWAIARLLASKFRPVAQSV